MWPHVTPAVPDVKVVAANTSLIIVSMTTVYTMLLSPPDTDTTSLNKTAYICYTMYTIKRLNYIFNSFEFCSANNSCT